MLNKNVRTFGATNFILLQTDTNEQNVLRCEGVTYCLIKWLCNTQTRTHGSKLDTQYAYAVSVSVCACVFACVHIRCCLYSRTKPANNIQLSQYHHDHHSNILKFIVRYLDKPDRFGSPATVSRSVYTFYLTDGVRFSVRYGTMYCTHGNDWYAKRTNAQHFEHLYVSVCRRFSVGHAHDPNDVVVVLAFVQHSVVYIVLVCTAKLMMYSILFWSVSA